MDKKLIINADDFGMSHSFNKAICNLLINGNISSTSLMANGVGYEEAIEMVNDNNLHNIGVHLTLTREKFKLEKALKYKSITNAKTLHDESGYLFNSTRLLRNNASNDDIYSEVKAQILKIKSQSLNISHVDSHMYSLSEIGLRGYKILFRIFNDLNLSCGIRIPKYIMRSPVQSLSPGKRYMPYIWFASKFSQCKQIDYSFPFPYFAPNHPTLEDKRQLFDTILRSIQKGVNEIHFHPAIEDDDLKRENPTWSHRVQEYYLLQEIDKNVLRDKYGIELITYNDIYKKLNNGNNICNF